MRSAIKTRETGETSINIEINLDEYFDYEINTDVNFLNHMLREFALHSGFGLKINAKSKDGDTHHLVEDIGITLGAAFKEALGDKAGICRFADIILPMDEALILAAVDISGRAHLSNDIEIKEDKVSDFEIVLFQHFLESFVQNSLITLHIKKLNGVDPHHIIEATFKALARILKKAVSIKPENMGKIPSTKGSL